MTRVNLHLTQQQIDRLTVATRTTGLSVAELIRRCVDAELGRIVERAEKHEVNK